MDEAWTLILLSLCMLIGCYVAGSVPLAFNLPEDKLRLVTVLGAGLLVGTALAVIIPEGVHTLYGAQHHVGHSHEKREAGVPGEIEPPGVLNPVDAPAASSDEEHTDMHNYIGISLVFGFIFMLLVDQLSNGNTTTNGDTESGATQNRHKITATIGLVVHAAADGVALGAAATTSQTHIEMIVFIAIMLHKAPAAFGLVSFLLHEGLDRVRIRKHLAVFSAAAPLLALITYFGLSQHDKEALSRIQATGLAMLFSAGTFLYVATVHVIPELLQMNPVRTVLTDGSVATIEHKGFTKLELFTMVIGSVFPVLLSLGHHH